MVSKAKYLIIFFSLVGLHDSFSSWSGISAEVILNTFRSDLKNLLLVNRDIGMSHRFVYDLATCIFARSLCRRSRKMQNSSNNLIKWKRQFHSLILVRIRWNRSHWTQNSFFFKSVTNFVLIYKVMCFK